MKRVPFCLVLLLICFLGGCQTLFQGGRGIGDEKKVEMQFQEALQLLHQGKPQEAYPLLEGVPSSSSSFYLAFLELQKIHYAQEKWEKFFSYAIFYRFHLLKQRENSKTKGLPVTSWANLFYPDLFSLEVFSLARYCFWEEASLVLSQGQEMAKELGRDSELEKAEQGLHLSTLASGIPGLLRDPKKRELPHSFAKEKRLWPIHLETLQQISHPKFLKMEIRSRCVSGSSRSSS